MAIIFDEKDRTFSLHTENSSYQMMIDRHDFLIHLYYGPGINGSAEYLIQYTDRGFSGNPSCAANDRTYSMDVLPQEMPVWGNGDFRSPSLIIEKADGTRGAEFKYSSHTIKKGKYALSGLPAVYDDMAETLEITLTDDLLGLELILLYGVIPEIDVICRAAKIINHSDETLYVEKIHSATVDMINGDHDIIVFCGRHMMERRPLRSHITNVSQRICSRRGSSSHQYNPFMIITDPETTDTYGNCFGLGFVYSGGFLAEAEKDQFGMTRIQMGLSDEDLHYPVKPEAVFTAPEVIMAFSREGLDGLSKRFHECINEHIIRGYYKHRRRPVLVNSWEAEYFEISRNKLLKLAGEAKALGIEMLVIDDGWFLGRNDDNSSLGDWTADPDKLGGTLEELVRDIKNAGLKCGIWMEPEMVSEDSSLFREHPDWALITPGRTPVRCRNQLVLDLSRKVIRDYIYGQIRNVLDTGVDYLKWDFNRSIFDAYSSEAEHQGSVKYDYVLGVYEILGKINDNYPEVLIEGCAGGGGRFDAGMLFYTPQIWCSDNTDPLDRAVIQYGTSFCYPASTISAHVSASPNQQTGRVTSLELRANTAMYGAFGYELDLGLLSEDEKEKVKQQIRDYREYQELITEGFYYRLNDPEKDAAFGWEFASGDGKEALVHTVIREIHGNDLFTYIRIKGLIPGKMYMDTCSGRSYSSDVLMNAGIPLPKEPGEYRTERFHFVVRD